ncbi:MAG: PEP_CTERM-anchored TLD domain-containing protein [Planctomycetaceae bacterium]|nr:PEP_CTERM-anchored TLD domain-containing protein [Planctomycetaceae bacterium]
MCSSFRSLIAIGVFAYHATCASAGLLTPEYETQLGTWLGESAVFVPVYTKTAGDDSAEFHASVAAYAQTITLIEVQIAGSDVWMIVGGYNPHNWSATDGFHLTPADSDRNAFIFNLSTTTKFGQKLGDPAGEYQTNNLAAIGPQFGRGADLLVDGDLLSGSAYNDSYGPDGPGLTNILGLIGTTGFVVGQMETYALKIAKQEPQDPKPGTKPGTKPKVVPEPSSMVLLGLGGLVSGLGVVRRRRKS